MAELDTAVRDYLGWSHVLDESADLDLTENQKKQADDKRKQAGDTVTSRLLGAYHWALVPTAPNPGEPFVITPTKAEGQAPSLAEQVSKRRGNDGSLSTQQAGATIRLALNRGPRAVGIRACPRRRSVEGLRRLCRMPRLRDQSVLNRGLVDQPLLWQQDGFALAQGYDETANRDQGLYLPTDSHPPAITDAVLVVKPALAVAQREAELAEAGRTSRPGGPSTAGTVARQPQSRPDIPPEPTKPTKTRFFGTRELNPDRYAMDFKKISDEVLAHLAATPGVNLTVRVEIEATTPEGFDENRVRTVSENANQLKFEQSGFEET